MYCLISILVLIYIETPQRERERVRACALTFVRRRCSCSKTFTLELTVDRNVTCPVSALCSRLYRAIPQALTSQCWNSFGNGRYRWIQLCYLLLPNFLFPFLVLQPSTQLISCRWPGWFFRMLDRSFSSKFITERVGNEISGQKSNWKRFEYFCFL